MPNTPPSRVGHVPLRSPRNGEFAEPYRHFERSKPIFLPLRSREVSAFLVSLIKKLQYPKIKSPICKTEAHLERAVENKGAIVARDIYNVGKQDLDGYAQQFGIRAEPNGSVVPILGRRNYEFIQFLCLPRFVFGFKRKNVGIGVPIAEVQDDSIFKERDLAMSCGRFRAIRQDHLSEVH
jgi:hypothetical protein